MNDLDSLREFRANLPSPDEAALRNARRQLIQVASRVNRGADRTGLSWRLPRSARRPQIGWLAGIATAAVAALAVLGLVIGQSSGSQSGRDAQAAVDAESSQTLHNAALVAMDVPELKPGNGQYLFRESIEFYGGTEQQADGSYREIPARATLDQRWMPPDPYGKQMERSRPYPTGEWGRMDVHDPCAGYPLEGEDENGNLVSHPCEPLPTIRYDLPTNGDEMLKYLREHAYGHNLDNALATVHDWLLSSYVPPRSLAAIFEALARVPGLSVRRDVVDLAGRKGVSVGSRVDGKDPTRLELVFDPHTLKFLGSQGVGQNGRIGSGSTILRTAVTDRMGQLPGIR